VKPEVNFFSRCAFITVIPVFLNIFFVFNIYGQTVDPAVFPIAVWLQQPSYSNAYRKAGINLFVGNTLDASSWNQIKFDKTKVLCTQNAFALSHLDDTLIYGWIQMDEPDNAQWNEATQTYDPCLDPSVIIARYDSMKARDSSRPVYLNLGMGVAYTPWLGRGTCTGKTDMYPVYNNGYLKGCDIASFDIYPVNSPDGDVSGKLWYVAKGIDSLKKWTENKKPVWCWIETTLIDKSSPRKPTAAEVKAEVWMALIHGAKGFGYFCHSFYPYFDDAALFHDTAMFSAVTKINQQIISLVPVLRTPDITGFASVTSSNAAVPVDIMKKHYQGENYIFAVAMRSGTTTATFTVDSGKLVEVLGENRMIPVIDGKFMDNFSSYGVHLYKITSKEINHESLKKEYIQRLYAYPNPCDDYVMIPLPEQISGNHALRITNSLGIVVYPSWETANVNEMKISCWSLPEGQYFYHIFGDNRKIFSGTFRVIHR